MTSLDRPQPPHHASIVPGAAEWRQGSQPGPTPGPPRGARDDDGAPPGVAELPRELLTRIMLYLPTPDLRTATGVCGSLAAVALPQLQRDLYARQVLGNPVIRQELAAVGLAPSKPPAALREDLERQEQQLAEAAVALREVDTIVDRLAALRRADGRLARQQQSCGKMIETATKVSLVLPLLPLTLPFIGGCMVRGKVLAWKQRRVRRQFHALAQQAEGPDRVVRQEAVAVALALKQQEARTRQP